MKSPREYLSDRIYGVIEECGGDITDHTEELIDLLVTDVCDNDGSEITGGGALSPEQAQIVGPENVGPMVKVQFTPQAWVNDYAIDVDPEGETEFEIPVADAMIDGRLRKDNHDETDVLKDHPNAPRWIKQFAGPFYIEILDRHRFYTTEGGDRDERLRTTD